jgi:hypothetical protein
MQLHASSWDGDNTMTRDFIDGMLAVMLPSMLVVAWLVWRANAIKE